MTIFLKLLGSETNILLTQVDQSKSASSHPLYPSYRPQIGLAFFAFLLVGANGGAGGVLLPSLSGYYKVDNSTLGFLFLAATTGYLLASFANGPMTEKLGQRRLLLLGAFSFVVGAIALGMKPPFAVLVFMRFLLGIGGGMLETGFNTYVTALPRRSTAVMNNLHAFYGVGALLGPIVASTILAAHGDWGAVYLVWGVLSIPLLAGCAAILRPTPSPTRAVQRQGDAPIRENTLAAALKLRVAWLATLFLFVYVGIEVSIGNWSYAFLLSERGQGTLLAGWVVSGYWLGLTLGRFLLARFFEKWGLGTSHLVEASIAIVIAGVLLVWLLPLSWIAIVGLVLIGFGLGPLYPTIIALMPALVPTRLLPSAIGFVVSISISGIALFPWLAGILAQDTGFWTLFPYSLVLTLIMLCVWLPLRGSARQLNG